MRKRLFEIIEASKDDDKLSSAYDLLMMITIIISIIPLAFKTTTPLFRTIDKVTVIIFITDYLLRLITADFKLKKDAASFFMYPITPMAIIDLLSILPSLMMVSNGLKLLKIFRLFRTFKVFRTLKVLRAFKFFRYSKNIEIIINVLKNTKDSLIIVGVLAIGYILLSALVIFNAEPDTFNNYFDAIYWATISLTTVGYGDVYCVSNIGKVITMLSSVFGIAIVALPSGIITAGYMDEINRSKKDEEE